MAELRGKVYLHKHGRIVLESSGGIYAKLEIFKGSPQGRINNDELIIALGDVGVRVEARNISKGGEPYEVIVEETGIPADTPKAELLRWVNLEVEG